MPTNREAMQQMWDATAKADASGTKWLTFAGDADILNLYHNGTFFKETFSANDLLKSFAACKQKNGQYKVGYDTWMTHEKFYAGTIREGWNPWSLRDGVWTEQELLTLYDEQIRTESTLSEDFIHKFIATLKKNGMMKNGRFTVNDEFKGALTQLINRHPSPPRRRWMEMIAYQLALEEIGDKMAAARMIATGEATHGEATRGEAARGEAARGEAARGEAAPGANTAAKHKMERQAARLKELEKVKSVSEAIEKSEAETISLADLQKKRRTIKP